MTRTLSEMMAGARGVVGQAEYRELHVSGASCTTRGVLER
jgi:hypothetical protein